MKIVGVRANVSTRAYFVAPKPPKGFPPVPRYANDSTVIELVVD